jgi:hypothetical protein
MWMHTLRATNVHHLLFVHRLPFKKKWTPHQQAMDVAGLAVSRQALPPRQRRIAIAPQQWRKRLTGQYHDIGLLAPALVLTFASAWGAVRNH